MAISVKDTWGNTENVASNAKGNTGVVLGGTALGLTLLNNGMGLLNGLTNNNNNNGNNKECVVSLSKYYEDRLADTKEAAAVRFNDAQNINARFTEVGYEMCNLRERVAVNETANRYQNALIDKSLGYINERFGTERQITNFEIGAKTCGFIKGTNVITPSQIGTTYANPTMVLDQHEAAYLERDNHGFSGCQGYQGYRGL